MEPQNKEIYVRVFHPSLLFVMHQSGQTQQTNCVPKVPKFSRCYHCNRNCKLLKHNQNRLSIHHFTQICTFAYSQTVKLLFSLSVEVQICVQFYYYHLTSLCYLETILFYDKNIKLAILILKILKYQHLCILYWINFPFFSRESDYTTTTVR